MAPPIFWFPQLLASLCSVGVAHIRLAEAEHPWRASAYWSVMLATAQWSLLSALHKAVPELSTKLFLARIQYCGDRDDPPGAPGVCGCNTRATRPMGHRAGISCCSRVIPHGNPSSWPGPTPHHGLIWQERHPRYVNGPAPIAVYRYGPFFWLWVCFSYGITLTCALLLIRTWRVSEPIYRKQVHIMLVGICGAVGGQRPLPGAHLSPWPQVDMTPIAFSPHRYPFWASACSGAEILDIVPVAHRTVLENMQDGIVVLDHLNRVAHLNPAASRIILGLPPVQV
jgi:PAS domain-containing protein